MKIIFVRPKPSSETIGLQHIMIVEPLELEILATLVERENDVRIIDMILEKKSIPGIIADFEPDVICLTGYITHIPVIIDYCRQIKRIDTDVITIVGGVHVEKFPEDIDDESIDFRVVRNATRTFPALIEFIKHKSPFPQGVLRKNEVPDPDCLPDYDFYVPIPNRLLTRKYHRKYFYVFHNKVALIKTSFGCPYHCRFCFCREITGGIYFERQLNDVMDELESIRQKEIYIVDDDFLLSPHRVTEFIRLLKERKINKRFLVYGRADFIARYPGIIRDFKNSGLRTVIVGLETFSETELQEFSKRTTGQINIDAMNVLNRNRVICYAAIIVSPSWQKVDFRNTYQMLKKLKIKFVNLQPLTPLKGTNLEYDDTRLVLDRTDYSRWDLAHVSIRPDYMSVGDFYNELIRLYDNIVFNPWNLISHIRYSLNMQIKMIVGLIKIRRQYKMRIREYKEYA